MAGFDASEALTPPPDPCARSTTSSRSIVTFSVQLPLTTTTRRRSTSVGRLSAWLMRPPLAQSTFKIKSVKASAVVGLSPLTQIIFWAVKPFAHRTITSFATLDEAREWLAGFPD